MHGTVEVPFDRVGAIVGRRNKALTPRVLLHDGQKLMGRIESEGMRFQMTSGMAIDLDVAKLDRLVMRDPKKVKAAGLDAARAAVARPAETAASRAGTATPTSSCTSRASHLTLNIPTAIASWRASQR